jgi:hypothetical protein
VNRAPTKFSAIVSAERETTARMIRADLFARCRAAIDQMGDEVIGFALVVWDREGDLRSSYNATRGPIGPALLPTLVADALNRHVAVMLASAKTEEEGS